MSTTIKIISVVAGILVGALIIVQFRTTTPLASSYPLDQIEAQKNLVKSYVDDETLLKSRIGSLRDQIDKALEQNQLFSQTANIETLSQLKKEIGLSELTGGGFVINLNDSKSVKREDAPADDGGIIYASDIRDIVNLLRSINASGISINDQRIIATSPISSVGNTLLVNNSHLSPPFSISVIGDYQSLLIRLEEATVLSDLRRRVQENGIEFSIKKSDYILLPIYNGQFRLKFIQTKENKPA